MSKYLSMIERVVSCARNDLECMLVFVDDKTHRSMLICSSDEKRDIEMLSRNALHIADGIPNNNEDDPRQEAEYGPR